MHGDEVVRVEDLGGLAELGALMGAQKGTEVPKPSTLRTWRTRGKIPPPLTELVMGPVWDLSRIEFDDSGEIVVGGDGTD